MKQNMTTRKQWKDVKQMDHQQFDKFCANVYMNGYNEGRKSVPGIDFDKVVDAIGGVKGVGPALLGRIKETLDGEFKGGDTA